MPQSTLTATAKILIVDDDREFCQLLSNCLMQAGYVTKACHHGEKALHVTGYECFEVILLDINLPGINGFKVCESLRRQGYQGKIIMLTQRNTSEDHITGLDIGADDYIAKPIEPAVLLARLRKQLEKNIKPQTILNIGNLTIDLDNRCTIWCDHDISLTNKEFEVLYLLAENYESILSRDALSRGLRGVEYDGIDRTLDLTISRLRKKFQEAGVQNGIVTVRGKGYKLVPKEWEVE